MRLPVLFLPAVNDSSIEQLSPNNGHGQPPPRTLCRGVSAGGSDTGPACVGPALRLERDTQVTKQVVTDAGKEAQRVLYQGPPEW